ncbi:MAG: hypothetical protein KGL39_20540 [Patescibacteria group bacterium]|nr:hypothetical protein [Patescibacteria group bacterium]
MDWWKHRERRSKSPPSRDPDVANVVESSKLKVARLLLENVAIAAIASRLDVSVSAAQQLANEVHREWAKERRVAYELRMALELAKLDNVEREAMAAYRRSRKPAQSRKQKFEVVNLPGSVDLFADDEQPQQEAHRILTEETLEERGQVGDPKFLALAKECVVERLKLMGAYKDDGRAGSLTFEQGVGLVRAVINLAEQDGEIGLAAVERLKQRTLSLLPTMEAGASYREAGEAGQAATVIQPEPVGRSDDPEQSAAVGVVEDADQVVPPPEPPAPPAYFEEI